MKKLTILLVLFGLSLSIAPNHRGNHLYQVISSHPHDVKKLLPHVETIHQKGRLWVVELKGDTPKHILKYLRPLSGQEKSYQYEGKPKISTSYKSLSPIDSIIQNIDSSAIRRDVEELSGFKTRAVGTRDNQEALKLINERFVDMGYEVKEICYQDNRCSIIADKVGKILPGKVLMIMAHMDSVGASFAGADDNASGTAVLTEIARVLKNYPNKKTFRFFVTNGEERGLLGAKHYAQKLQDENKLSELELVINMDMVGYNSNGIVELETDPEYEGVARWFADLASQYTTLQTKITLGAWGSDHVPFLKKGVSSILTIEDWETKTPCYHRECDKPDTLNYQYAAEIGKLNTSAILSKDL